MNPHSIDELEIVLDLEMKIIWFKTVEKGWKGDLGLIGLINIGLGRIP